MVHSKLSISASIGAILLRRLRAGPGAPPPGGSEAAARAAMAEAVLSADRRRRKLRRPIRVALDDAQLGCLRRELALARAMTRDPVTVGQATRLIRRIGHRLRTGEWPKPKPRQKAGDAWPEEVRAEAEAVVREAVGRCCRVARRKSSDLGLPPGWRPKLRISWHEGRATSRGGALPHGHYGDHGGVSLALAHLVPKDGTGGGRFVEYAHIKDDPTIGSFETGDWRNVLRALVAHEVAHAVQYWIHRQGRVGRHRQIDYRRAHGQGFQAVYALLRRETVNPLLRAEREGAAEPGVRPSGTPAGKPLLSCQGKTASPPRLPV